MTTTETWCQYHRCGGTGRWETRLRWRARIELRTRKRVWLVCEGCADLLTRELRENGRPVLSRRPIVKETSQAGVAGAVKPGRLERVEKERSHAGRAKVHHPPHRKKPKPAQIEPPAPTVTVEHLARIEKLYGRALPSLREKYALHPTGDAPEASPQRGPGRKRRPRAGGPA